MYTSADCLIERYERKLNNRPKWAMHSELKGELWTLIGLMSQNELLPKFSIMSRSFNFEEYYYILRLYWIVFHVSFFNYLRDTLQWRNENEAVLGH